MSLNGNRIGGQYKSPLTKKDKIILRLVGIGTGVLLAIAIGILI